jgi:hypothetical protein
MQNLSRYLEDLGPFSVAPFEAGSRSKARALELWNRRRVRYGLRPARDWGAAPLLSAEVSKLQKNEIHTLGLLLAPSKSSGLVNVCGWSTAGCEPPNCLSGAGNNGFARNALVRAARTAFLYECPSTFWRVVGGELERALAKHGSCVFRSNVLSDLRTERIAPGLSDIDGLLLMDYTKAPIRARRRGLALGWSLTYSVSERTTPEQLRRAMRDVPVAVVSNRVPRGAIDGDVSDERYRQGAGDLVVLSPKGSMPRHGGIVRDDLTA